MTETMTEADFDRQYDDAEKDYIRADQKMAKLFVDCGWTQQKIADHKNISRQWVEKLVRFGRFLEFATIGSKCENIAERTFRGCWDETDQALSEDDRFRAVAVALGVEPAPKPVAVIVPLRAPSNIEASVREISSELNMTSDSRLSEIRAIVTCGAPHVIDLVRQKKVALHAACNYARATPQAQQATDPAEIKRIGNDLAKSMRSSAAAKPKKGKKVQANKPKSIAFLPPRDLSKLDTGDERIPGQPVQLWPAYVQRLMKHAEHISLAASQIKLFVKRSVEKNEFSVTPEEFTLGLEKTLAHKPVSGKTNGEQTDYAKKARNDIANLDENLDRAIGWLTAIRAALKTVESGRAQAS